MPQQLTMMDALDGLQKGLAWREQRDESARTKKLRDGQDAANAAFGQVLKDGETKFYEDWDAANPAQPAGLDSPAQPRQRPAYKPDEGTLFRAAEARGLALAKAGDVDGYFKNAASVAPMRVRAIGQALQNYQADGNVEKLVRTAHATRFDGLTVQKVETLRGGDGAAGLGSPAGPDKVRVTLSDGSVMIEEPKKLIAGIQNMLRDPVAAMAKADELDYQRLLQQVKTDGELKKIGAKEDSDRRLNQQQHDLGLSTLQAKFGYDSELAGVKNNFELGQIGARGAQDRSTASHRAGLDAAAPFTLSEGQERFTMQPGADGKRVPVRMATGAPKASKTDEVKSAENLLDTLAKAGIGGSKDLATGRVLPDALTQRAAQRVNQYRQSQGLSFDEAVAKVRKEMEERGLLK